jgi:uncharacterized protein (TIGR03067 family)
VLERKKEKDAKADRELLQGTWKAVKVTMYGKTADPQFMKEHPVTFTFAGNTFTMVEATTKDQDTKTESTFTLDPAKSPKQMTMTPTNGPLQGVQSVLIYELRDDTLRLAMPNKPGWNGPPQHFEQEDVAVVALERQKR